MSARKRTTGPVGSALAFAAIVASGCDAWPSTGPEMATQDEQPVAFSLHQVPRVTVCHRTGDDGRYVQITVASRAVPAHLDHGDGMVGDPVPGAPDMRFDEDCQPVQARQEITVTGRWNGTYFQFFGLFTVSTAGPVDATATVSGADPGWLMRLALLGHDPAAPNPPGSCSTHWLPEDVPLGPDGYAPTLTAHWDELPPGTYCLNVVSAVPVPPYPAPYSWTATITYP